MKKRALAAVLWLYAMWYLGAMIAETFGLSAALGPILGAASAALFAVDPRRILWAKTSTNKDSTDTRPGGHGLQNLA